MSSLPLSALRELQAEYKDLDKIAIVSGVINHELLNVLNNISLQVAVLQKQIPENFHPGLAVIHEQASAAGEILRSLQQYCRQHQSPLYPIDLNRLIRQQFEMESRKDLVRLDLPADLPPVLGTASEMRILLQLLLSSAARLVPEKGTLVIQTSQESGKIIFRLVAHGRSTALDLSAGLLLSLGKGEELVPRLELAGCQQIVRHWGGTLRAESLSLGGLAFVVELPEAGEKGAS